MRRLAIVLVLVALAGTAAAAPSPSVPGAKTFVSCAGAGPYWPTATLALTGDGLGRVQGGGARPSRQARPGQAKPRSRSPGIADRRRRGPRRRLGARHRRDGFADSTQERPRHGDDRDRGVGALQPLDRRRLALVGRRPERRGAADRSGAAQGDRPHPRRRRPGRPRLPRRAGVGRSTTATAGSSSSRPRRTRHAGGNRPRRRAGADRVVEGRSG